MTATLPGKYADELHGIENAVGIVQLRLSNDEWARRQGEKMIPAATVPQLLAFIATQALDLRAQIAAEVDA